MDFMRKIISTLFILQSVATTAQPVVSLKKSSNTLKPVIEQVARDFYQNFKNVKGDTLKSPDLWWDQNTKLFYTDKYAQYLRKDKQIYPGKGLEATQDFKRITFKEPTGIIHVSDTSFSK